MISISLWKNPFSGQLIILCTASQVILVVKNLPTNAEDVRDLGLIPGLGRSPGEGHDNPF